MRNDHVRVWFLVSVPIPILSIRFSDSVSYVLTPANRGERTFSMNEMRARTFNHGRGSSPPTCCTLKEEDEVGKEVIGKIKQQESNEKWRRKKHMQLISH